MQCCVLLIHVEELEEDRVRNRTQNSPQTKFLDLLLGLVKETESM